MLHRHAILSPIRYLNTLSLYSLKVKREIERESGRMYSGWRRGDSASFKPGSDLYGPSIPVVVARRTKFRQRGGSVRGIRDALQGGHRSLLMHPAQFRVEESPLSTYPCAKYRNLDAHRVEINFHGACRATYNFYEVSKLKRKRGNMVINL